MKPVKSNKPSIVTGKPEVKQKTEKSPTSSTKGSPRAQQLEKKSISKQSIEDYKISSDASDKSKLKHKFMSTAVIIASDKELQEFIDFIKEPANLTRLEYIKSIEFLYINDETVKQFQELLDFICDKKSSMSNLASLKIGGVYTNIDLSFLPESLTSILIGEIAWRCSFNFPNAISQKLDLLSIGNVGSQARVSFPEASLVCSKFTIGDVAENAIINNFPTNMVLLPTFSCGEILNPKLKGKIDKIQKTVKKVESASIFLRAQKAHRASAVEKRTKRN